MAENGKQEGIEEQRWLLFGNVMLRGGASILCLVSLSLIASDTIPGFISFHDLAPFCYLLVIAIFVCVYSALQTATEIHHFVGRQFHYNTLHHYIFIAMDISSAVLLLSSSSTVLGVTTTNYIPTNGPTFINQANASAGLGLASFLLLFFSTIISVYRFQHQRPK